jgi:hypothetical protein
MAIKKEKLARQGAGDVADIAAGSAELGVADTKE